MDKRIEKRFHGSYALSKAKAFFIAFVVCSVLYRCDIRIVDKVDDVTTDYDVPAPALVPVERTEEEKRKCLVERYRSYDGIFELTGNNDHPKIDYFFELLNMAPRQSWCGALVHAAFKECGIPTQINAWSPTGHNPRNLVYFKNEMLKEPKLADATTFWNINKKRIDHVGFWDGDISDSKYYSFEGNYSNRSGRVIRSYKLTYSISRHL